MSWSVKLSRTKPSLTFALFAASPFARAKLSAPLSSVSLRRRSISSPVVAPEFAAAPHSPQTPQTSTPALATCHLITPTPDIGQVRALRLLSNDAFTQSKEDLLVDTVTGQHYYSKVRQLEETEIVSTLSSHSTSPPTPRWTIHRPRSGWYIALRPASPTASTSATIGPQGFVALEPVRTRARSGTQLGFTLHLRSSSSPPTPPPTSSSTNSTSPSVEITIPVLDTAGASPGHGAESTARFVLRPLPPPPPEPGWWGAIQAAGSGLRNAVVGAPNTGWGCYAVLQEGQEEILRWEDTTTAFATRTAGVLHLAPRLPTLAGIDNSFWVSIALAFIDFTEDQEAYLAAAQGD